MAGGARVIAYALKLGGVEAAVKSTGELKTALKEAREQLDLTERGSEAYDKARQRVAALKLAQKELNAEQRETEKTIASAAEAGSGSYRELQNRVQVLKREYKELDQVRREGADGEVLRNSINADSRALKKLDAEIGDYFRNVGDYRGAIADAIGAIDFGGIAGGDLSSLNDVGSNIGQLRSSFKGLTGDAAGFKQVASLIGPAFAFQAILGGLTAVGAAISEAVERTRAGKVLLSRAGGVEDDALNDTTADLITAAEFLGESQEGVFEAANALAKAYELDISDAIKQITTAGLAGANATGELLATVREYPVQFRDAGISADAFLATITRQVSGGVFDDKAIDSIKEAGLQLRTITPAARAAVNAIGIDDATITKLKSEQGLVGLIQAVIDRLGELPAQSEAVGEVLATVFRAAGEDAGPEFLASIDLINDSLEGQIDLTNRLVKEDKARLDVTREIAKEQARLEEKAGPALQAFNLELQRSKGELLSLFTTLQDLATGEYKFQFIADFEAGIDSIDEKLNTFLLDSLESAYDLDGDFIGRYLKDALSPANLAEDTAAARAYFADNPLQVGLDVSAPDAASVATSGSSAPGVATLSPEERAAALALTQARRKAAAANAEAASKAAASQAKEAQSIRDSLTGLKEAQARLTEIRTELAAAAGDANAVSILQAERAVVEATANALETQSARALADGQALADQTAQDYATLAASLNQPGTDRAELLTRLGEAAAANAELNGRLTRIADGLATPQDLAAVIAAVDRANPVAAPQALQTATAPAPVESLTPNQEALQAVSEGAVEEGSRRATEALDEQAEKVQGLSDTYGQAFDVIGATMRDFYAGEEQNAAAFFKAFAKNAILSIVKTIRARALEGFATVLASDPTPLAVVRAAARTGLIIAAAEGASALASSFDRGGTVASVDARKGGAVVGPSHAQGGIKTVVRSSGRQVEIQGGEGILSRKTMDSAMTVDVNGQRMRFAEAASMMNVAAGGRSLVKPNGKVNAYADGGYVPTGASRAFTRPTTTQPGYRASERRAEAAVGVAELSEASVARIAEGVRTGARVGTEDGAMTGTREGAREGQRDAADAQRLSKPVAI